MKTMLFNAGNTMVRADGSSRYPSITLMNPTVEGEHYLVPSCSITIWDAQTIKSFRDFLTEVLDECEKTKIDE